MNKLLVICGPMMSGKTLLAQALAEAGGSNVSIIVDDDRIRWVKPDGGILIVDGVSRERLNKWAMLMEDKRYDGGYHGRCIYPMLIVCTQHIPSADEIALYKDSRVYYILTKAATA